MSFRVEKWGYRNIIFQIPVSANGQLQNWASPNNFVFFTVIWNPWVEQARELADFGDDEYPNMVCVEAGHVSSPVILLPGTAFEASQILQVG